MVKGSTVDGPQGGRVGKGPMPITERDPKKRAAIVGAVQFLEVASDALFQDRSSHEWQVSEGAAAGAWSPSLALAHKIIREVIDERRARLEGAEEVECEQTP